MNTKPRNFLILALGLAFVVLAAHPAEAQLRRPPVFQPAPVCQAVPSVYIRNLRYDDYSRYARLSAATVTGGGWIQINTKCLRYDGQIVVTLQDVTRGDGSGVTAFKLTNVRYGQNIVTAQVPNYPIFRNRTFHVGLFVYGQPLKTANPGSLTIH